MRGGKTKDRLWGVGDKSLGKDSVPPCSPTTIGQLISQYKHSSRTGITAPPAA